MNSQEKIIQLKRIISDQLTPLINGDYWLLEAPYYYYNAGDILIWQGELDFLKTIPYKCKGMSSFYSEIPTNIKDSDIILLQGGGNFGDLWPVGHTYHMNVVKKYPNNRIIFFPQTVYFRDPNNMRNCAEELKRAPKTILCARDKKSYDILKENFTNAVLLVPDMAFYTDMSRWSHGASTQEALLLNRDDVEYKSFEMLDKIKGSKNVHISDWTPLTESAWQKNWFRRLRKYLPHCEWLYNWYAKAIFRPYMINSAINQLSTYQHIYTMRLHAAILTILLGKASELTWFDNSYGKNSSLYETWLSDCDGITFIQ